jgi:predicted ATPase
VERGTWLAENESTVLDYHAVDTRVPFVGRASELRALLAFLKRGGALTLVGPGGVGKSRLAHEAVTRFARERATETVFVPLAGVLPDAVVGTVMSQLGILQEPGRSPHETLADRLRDRHVVIALDNCEHAPDETSALIDTFRAAPHITVIATSQRRLDYADEAVFEVEPFSTDDGIAFFLARAGLDASSITEATLATVSTIVERVDGLAVALDLAAARLASLSLELLADELGELRPYQLRSTRGLDPRHRTIGNVISWSHSQLSEVAKRAFAEASLYADEFDEDDLCALGDLTREEMRAALDELVLNSLVMTTEFGYRMLLPIRAVATRMLAGLRNRKALDDAFALRMNAVASALWSQIRTGNAAGAVARLHARYADLCATLAWALKRPQDRLGSIDEVLSAVMQVWAEGGRFSEGMRWIERFESIAQRLSAQLRGRLYFLGLCVMSAAADYHRMVETGPLTISAFTIAGDQLGLARAYNALAIASLNTGRFEDATMYVETSIRFYEQVGYERGIATARINQANVLYEGFGDHARALEILHKAIAALEREGPPALCGIALGDVAEVEYAMAEYDAAVAHAHQAIERFEANASPTMIAWCHETLARISLARGDLSDATKQLLIACDLLRRLPQPLYIARVAEITGRCLLRSGNARDAALALAVARRYRSERALVAFGIFAADVAADEASLAQQLAPKELAELARNAAALDLARICSTLVALLSAG